MNWVWSSPFKSSEDWSPHSAHLLRAVTAYCLLYTTPTAAHMNQWLQFHKGKKEKTKIERSSLCAEACSMSLAENRAQRTADAGSRIKHQQHMKKSKRRHFSSVRKCCQKAAMLVKPYLNRRKTLQECISETMSGMYQGNKDPCQCHSLQHLGAELSSPCPNSIRRRRPGTSELVATAEVRSCGVAAGPPRCPPPRPVTPAPLPATRPPRRSSHRAAASLPEAIWAMHASALRVDTARIPAEPFCWRCWQMSRGRWAPPPPALWCIKAAGPWVRWGMVAV